MKKSGIWIVALMFFGIMFPSLVYANDTEVSMKVNKVIIDVGANGKVIVGNKTYSEKVDTYALSGSNLIIRVIPDSKYEVDEITYYSDSNIIYDGSKNEIEVINFNSDISLALSFKEKKEEPENNNTVDDKNDDITFNNTENNNMQSNIINNNQNTIDGNKNNEVIEENNQAANINRPIINKNPIVSNVESGKEESFVVEAESETDVSNNKKYKLVKADIINNKELDIIKNTVEAYNYGDGQVVVLIAKNNNKEDTLTFKNIKSVINSVLSKEDFNVVANGQDAYLYFDATYSNAVSSMFNYEKYVKEDNYKCIDLNLFKVIGDKRIKVYKTNKKIELTLKLDDSIIKDKVKYTLLSAYNTKVHTFSDIDRKKDTLTVKTSIFNESLITWEEVKNKNYLWTILPIIVITIGGCYIYKKNKEND